MRKSESQSVRAGRVVGACLALVLAAASLYAAEAPKARPANWAQPVLNSSIGNLYKVSDDLYRSEQVGANDLPDLRALGIRTIYNLRHHHDDSQKLAKAGITLLSHELNAGSVTAQDLKEILEDIRKAPKPVLVHCWHGSDRTGFVVAGYRVAFQKWSKEAAAEELRSGGYGYHARTYPNVIKTLLAAELD